MSRSIKIKVYEEIKTGEDLVRILRSDFTVVEYAQQWGINVPYQITYTGGN